jgi:hypothetical protein
MMDHEQYRLLIGADPNSQDAQAREHRESCQECALYTQRLLRFESRLQRALNLDISARANLPAVKTRRWMALAASVLLGAVVAGGIWLALPQRTLAAAVVAHMAGEPQAWQRTDVSVPEPVLNAVLWQSNLRLRSPAGLVSYASSCLFRGHDVPHLVVQTESGPVTVMVLVHETVSKPQQFNEQGYRGTIVPVPGHGSIAVLMRDPGADGAQLERIAVQVRDAIIWTR